MAKEVKLMVTGEGGVGKSAFCIQYVANQFVEEYDPTIDDSWRKQINLYGETMLLEIADIGCYDEWGNNFRDQYMRGAEVFILIYSITSRRSFDGIISNHYDRILRIKDVESYSRVLIVGNKKDLESERQVTTQEGEDLAHSLGLKFIEVSAKTRENVEQAIEMALLSAETTNDEREWSKKKAKWAKAKNKSLPPLPSLPSVVKSYYPEQLRVLFDYGVPFSDVQIKANHVTIPLHRVVLATHCPDLFERISNEELQEIKEDSKRAQTVLKWLYSGLLSPTDEVPQELARLASTERSLGCKQLHRLVSAIFRGQEWQKKIESQAVIGALGPAFENLAFSDVTVELVRGSDRLKIVAHRAVLAARLTKFFKIFPSAPTIDDPCEIEAVVPEAWSRIPVEWTGGLGVEEAERDGRWLQSYREAIKFLYTDSADLTEETVVEVLAAAVALELSYLAYLCAKFIAENVSLSNVFMLWAKLQAIGETNSSAYQQAKNTLPLLKHFVSYRFETLKKSNDYKLFLAAWPDCKNEIERTAKKGYTVMPETGIKSFIRKVTSRAKGDSVVNLDEFELFKAYRTALHRHRAEQASLDSLAAAEKTWSSLLTDEDLTELKVTEAGQFKLVSSQALQTKAQPYGVETFPPSLAKLKRLTEVVLRGNTSLLELPPVACHWKNLTSLDLASCGLTTLSVYICYMQRLETLNLSQNSLSGLPPTLDLLTNLQTLSAGNNSLNTLPDVCFPRSLTTLDLSSNRLSHLPQSLAGCSALEALNLANNNFILFGSRVTPTKPVKKPRAKVASEVTSASASASGSETAAASGQPDIRSSDLFYKGLTVGADKLRQSDDVDEAMAAVLLEDTNSTAKVDLKGSDALFAALAKGTTEVVKEHQILQQVRELLEEAKKQRHERRVAMVSELIGADAQETYVGLLDDDTDDQTFSEHAKLAVSDPRPKAADVDDSVLMGLRKLRTLSLAQNTQLGGILPGIGRLKKLTTLDISSNVKLTNFYSALQKLGRLEELITTPNNMILEFTKKQLEELRPKLKRSVWLKALDFAIERLDYEYSPVSGNGPFKNLPEELVLKIFSFVPPLTLAVVAQVCRHWHLLSAEPELCRRMPMDVLTVAARNSPISIGRRIRSMAIMFSPAKVIHIPNLEQVQGQTQLRSGSFTELGPIERFCKNLEHIRIDRQRNNYFASELTRIVTNNADNLRSLSMNDCDIFKHLNMRNAMRLERLELRDSVITLCLPVPSPKLRYLSFAGCNCSEPVLKETLKTCDRGIRELDVSCAGVRDRIVKIAGKRFTQLQVLRLKYCDQITQLGVAHMLNKRRQTLRSLDLMYSGIKFAIDPNNNRDAQEKRMREFGALFNDLEELQCNSDLTGATSGVGEFVCGLATSNPKLRSLKLQAAVDAELGLLCMNLGDQLQKLDVRGCVLSAGTVQTIAESCPKLVALDLARVESIDDNLAKVLANGLPHLRYLSLCGCSKITDEGGIHIAKRCRELIFLSLSLSRVTKKTVAQIGKDLQHLKALCVPRDVVDSCSGLTSLRYIEFSTSSSSHTPTSQSREVLAALAAAGVAVNAGEYLVSDEYWATC